MCCTTLDILDIILGILGSYRRQGNCSALRPRTWVSTMGCTVPPSPGSEAEKDPVSYEDAQLHCNGHADRMFLPWNEVISKRGGRSGVASRDQAHTPGPRPNHHKPSPPLHFSLPSLPSLPLTLSPSL